MQSNNRSKKNKQLSKEKTEQIPRLFHGPQIKYFDYNAFGSVTSTIAYNALSGVGQGSGQSERVGDLIYPLKMDVHMNVVTANADVYNTCRFVWFRWRPNNNSLAPGTNSILESPGTQGTLSHYNYEGRQEYTVLKDLLESYTGTATNPTVDSNKLYRFTIPLNGTQVFNLGGTTGTNQLYFLNLSDSSVTPFPTVNLWTRLWYTDI